MLKFKFGIKTLLLVGALMVLAGCSHSDGSASLNGNGPDSEKNDNSYYEYYRRGASNPKIVLEEYSDFFCPHCRNVQPILKQLLEDFPNDLALEYHHFSFMGSEAVHTGNECAGEQDKFWEFHDEAYTKQNEMRSGGKDAVIDLAQNLGLDREEFKQCLLSDKYKPKIEAQKKLAREKYDISATPSFVIDGKLIELESGENYYDGLTRIINEMLSKPLA